MNRPCNNVESWLIAEYFRYKLRMEEEKEDGGGEGEDRGGGGDGGDRGGGDNFPTTSTIPPM